MQRLFVIFTLLFCGLFCGVASAQSFSNSTVYSTNATSISIPNAGQATPYPSSITVSGVNGTVTDVNVTLTNISHDFPDDVDILLVGPQGQKVMLLSDAGSTNDLSNNTLTFDDEAASTAANSGSIPSGSYKPTNHAPSDSFAAPAPAGPYGTALSAFDSLDPNGAWSLYVVDDASGQQGQISGGWTLEFTINPTATSVPGSGTSGPASPYPLNVTVVGAPSTVNGVAVTLANLNHSFPDDLDILLVGPQGQKAMLLSDAGGSSPLTNATLNFSDMAVAQAPDNTAITNGTYQPTDYETGDSFNAPAPTGPYGTSLSVFDGTDPNGTWSLYVMDDKNSDSGSLTSFALTLGPNFTVTKTADDDDGVCSLNDCSLREAIKAANFSPNVSTLTFATGVTGTINLTGTLPTLSTDINVQGPGAKLLTVQRNTGGNYRIFYVDNGTTTGPIVNLNGLTVSNADSSGGGGGLLNSRGTMTVTDCVFSGNKAPFGGGINNFGGTMTITGSTFSNNTATTGGGGVINDGTLTLTNCTFSGNSASTSGGGLRNDRGSVTIGSCTFSGNTAPTAGGAYNSGAVGVATLQVGNTIFKAGAQGANLANANGTTTSQGYNLSSDNGGGFLTANSDQINTDPLLGALADNGGPTPTHALLTGSLAIDGGNTALTTDQRGQLRPSDQINLTNANGGNGSDIGAYEYDDLPQNGSPSFVVTSLDDVNDGSCNAGHCSLREAINAANTKAGADVITFVPGLTGTIQLAGVLPALSTDINLQGPGAKLLTVRRNTDDEYRIFLVDNGTATGPIVNLSGLSISNAKLSSGGGGLLNANGTVTITDCVFNGNQGSFGGAINNFGGTMTITGSTFDTNKGIIGGAAAGGAGGAIVNDGTLTITNSTFSGNSAVRDGGALRNDRGSVTINNCTFSGNTAPTAGGIYNFGTAGTATLQINNTTLKTGTQGVNLTNGTGTITSQGYNLSSDNGGGFLTATGDQININPLLGALADNGGPTPTHALLSGSPALNAGDPAFAPPPTTDQRGSGFPRVQGERLDIGAYEATILSIDDPTIIEGSGGNPTTLKFTVTLSSAASQTVTVDYATQDGTAPAPGDYISAGGTLTFAPGETSKTIGIDLQDDALDEASETFKVILSNATGAAIFKSQGTGTITDDDPAPSLSINDISVTETNGGSAQAVFTLSLSAVSGQPLSVTVQTGNAGSPEATPGTDYVALPATIVTIPAGQLSKTVNVTLKGDIIDESDEKFSLLLSNPVNATISDNAAIGTIVDNDDPPLISSSAPNVTEGNAGTSTMTFTIKLSAASARNISVQYQTANSTTFPATAGADYTAVPLTTALFLAGETTKTVNVTVNGDTLDEDNERIALSLTNPVNATLGTITDGIIVDDDAAPSLFINDTIVTEGHSGTKLMIFNVNISAISGRAVTVSVQTGNGGSPAATAGVDFVAITPTLLTFTPGQTTKQVTVTINGDRTVEPDEKLAVILSGAVSAIISDNAGVGTIFNDDAAPAPLLAPSASDGDGNDKGKE